MAYVATGYLGLAFATAHPASTTIWAPSGVAIAAALAWGRGVAPVVFTASLVLNLYVLGGTWLPVVIAAASTLEVVLAAALVRRFAGGRDFFSTGRHAFTYSLLAGFVAPAVAAIIAALAIAVQSGDWGGLPRVFVVWWLGDAGGAQLVAPLLLSIAVEYRDLIWTRRRRIEFIVMASLIAIIGGVTLAFDAEARMFPVAFLVLPLAVWAAFRFTPRESTLVNLVLAVGLVLATLHGHGPFGGLEQSGSLVVVQLFVNIACLTTLPLAGGVRERREALNALDLARAELELRVGERTAELSASNRRLQDEAAERARAMQALAESQASLEEAQKAGQIGSWRWDVDSDRITWSAEMYRLFGRSPGSFVPSFAGYRELLEPGDAARMETVVRECMQNGGSYRFEHRVFRQDGAVVWLDGRGRAVFDEQGQLIRLVGTGQDITERKLAELEVRRLNEELEARIEVRTQELARANAELESFNYSVSHDLRGPLRNIGGFAEIVLEELDQGGSVELRGNLQRIIVNARRMNDIIAGMLALANASRGELEYGDVDLSRICREVTADLAAQSPDRRVVTEIPEGLVTVGDARLLRVLVTNLISNAWKFTARRPEGRAHVRVGLADGPHGPELFVRDDGAGFDPALSAQLFLPFRRLHQRSEFDGTGIGLATVARIAERHGGGVRGEGAPGEGAVFFVHLPHLSVRPAPET